MPTIRLENWVDWSNPDYYTMFVKSWIPFNAWFMDTFYDESNNRTRDRQIIDHIKENPNKFRDKIINLLGRNGQDAELFFSHLEGLDRELEAHTLKNRGERVGFSNMRLSYNPSTVKNEEYGAYKYKCEKITGATQSWKCQIMKRSDNSTVCQFSLTKWDLTSFREHQDYIGLKSETQKSRLEECFLSIDPRPVAKVVLPVISKGGREVAPPRSILISESRKRFFTDDKLLVSKVLIEILYSLRCMVFHGHLDPTGSNQGVYEHAFYIMNILIKELV